MISEITLAERNLKSLAFAKSAKMKPSENKMENETKKTKAIVRSPQEKRKAVWAGAQSLMNQPKDQKEAYEQKMILTASKVIGVSPFGINILGNVPYLNKLGLNQKAKQYGGALIQFKYAWIQYAKDDKEKAICSSKIVNATGKELCDWIVGECSPVSMKMGTLAGYQNHMAQTRAHNRAALEVYGVKIHEEMMENLEKLRKGNEINEGDASNIAKATTSSAEEMSGSSNQPTPGAKPNTAPTIQETLASIKIAGDQETLRNTRDKVKSAKVYKDFQKRIIIDAIDARLDQLNGLKEIQQ